MKTNHRLPSELMHVVDQSTPDNDWLRLKNTFRKTPRTRRIMHLVRMHYKTTPKNLLETDGGSAEIHITTDCDGRITILELTGLNLRDEDIADLSNLPPKLNILDLIGNELTAVGLTELPHGLRRLHLEMNRISNVSLDQLPESLELLGLSSNRLRHVPMDKLPQSLRCLHLDHNQLLMLRMGNIPSELEVLCVRGNRGIILDPDGGNGILAADPEDAGAFIWLTTSHPRPLMVSTDASLPPSS